MNIDVLLTNKELCVGCNKCIGKCLVKANVAFLYKGENRVKVDHLKCIHCGACIEICDHNARDYRDDTEQFFRDLKKGEPVTVIAAPSIRYNFSNYKRLFGYLKSLNVKFIYDVSFGADITTWAYLKIIEEQGVDSLISQPCPVIVNYIQKYRPELICKLAPIHSPMMCLAIYLKNYLGIKDRIAFLSPCIGKIDEINEKCSSGFVNYNITYKKVDQYLGRDQLDLMDYPEIDFDNDDCGFGLLFSRPGGLRENIELYKPGAWIRQVEGTEQAFFYLDGYAKRLSNKKQLPMIVDILNCEHGCNLGTGTTKFVPIDDADYEMNILKEGKLKKVINYKQATQETQETLSQKVFRSFDNLLNLKDFVRNYEDKSYTINKVKVTDLEPIFAQLHKTTEESRRINCFACGFGNCQEFAKAVAQGTNHVGNCIDYNRKELVSKNQHLSITNKEIKQLHYLATHDFLTNIPNRYYLEEYLRKQVLINACQENQSALLFIDLDNFKVVNDSFGHANGDQILLDLVDRLLLSLDQDVFLARLGGDEFAVVLKSSHLEKAKEVANRLLQSLRIKEFRVESYQASITITASIGIMMIDGTLDAQTLFSYADVALYKAKEEGKNRMCFIQTDVDKEKLSVSNRIILLLNEALKDDRLILYFQPIYKMNGEVLHYEALLRLLDQDENLVFPNEFLPTAERFGLISQLDRWVVAEAIEVLENNLEVSVFVNISASSLGDDDFLQFIEEKLVERKIQPARLGFEITETAVIRDLDQADQWIRKLKSLGCRFALDDFGVGFLTFTHLQKLSVDYLKIDGSFIRNLDVDSTNQALVKAINTVVHALGKVTIAEYVENEKIWSTLAELNVDCGQGYYLGRPSLLSNTGGQEKTEFRAEIN